MARKRKTNLKKVKRTKRQIGGLNQSSLDPRKQPPRMPPEDEVVIGAPVPPEQPPAVEPTKRTMPYMPEGVETSVNLPPEFFGSQPQEPPVGAAAPAGVQTQAQQQQQQQQQQTYE